MIISSSAFAAGQVIPDIYGCRGRDVNPPLETKEVPAKAKSLVLLVDDPDAPAGDWTHWLVWNISPQITSIEADSIPLDGVIGLNDFGDNRYGGPCPPAGTHRYQFKVYALDAILNLPTTTRKPELLLAMAGHILDQAILIGTYSH
ncbi:YbhB/YbcL family Raf kinase inhibitor-like protein [Candidatus Falkowbacteria bacterium CG23_combo_of_CG06-09_8_20_14_all_41_10]|uniref:YbhB/YbcL family Raf kinase inhibitor-like protein n=1 Tax=Candidatus Falkowbacteria bacterium CG23_combo_of_CG06-09_8_20_14_all_41_10 TaxID=1974571 RepID=A0A2G9ZNK6_9BACT|nr:MAG: YbhB/YbcL family Raf kinase inhibitor-like protein [Candidatus Falkowbacteria bacterium CG23_combo_of_CG06-09_8_20_14_all_41_10]